MVAAGCSYGQNNGNLKRYPPSVYKAGGSIFHLIRDKQGILYFATDGGIVQYDGSRWQIIGVSNYPYVTCIEQANNGTIYVGSYNNFGFLQANNNGKLIYNSLSDSLKESLDGIGEVWQIVHIGNDVYFQTDKVLYKWVHEKIEVINLKGSYIFNINGQIFGSSSVTKKFGPIRGDSIIPVNNYKILDDNVYGVFKYNSREWLIVSSENGLFIYDTRSKTISLFDCETGDYLKKHSFWEGTKLSDELYAFETMEGGMVFSDKNGKILDTLNKESGLMTNSVYHAVLGNNDDLWIGTDDGIAKIDLNSLDNIDFPVEDDHSNDVAQVSEIVATGDENSYHYWFNNPLDSVLVLPFNSKPSGLTIYFANPKMSGEDIEYSYKLIGQYGEWSEWQQSNQKRFTMLAKGDYSFRIKARNRIGFETKEAGFDFRIDIPWYKTIQAYLFIIGIIGFVSFGIFQLRTAQLNHTKKVLEKLVSKRTSDLVIQQKRLEKVNNELLNINKELDNFVYHTSHDLKAPLKSVLGLITLSKKESTNNKDLSSYLNMMEKSIHKLEEFILSVIEYSTNAKSEVINELIDFDEIINESLEQLNEYRKLKDIRIIKKISTNNSFHSDPKRLKIVFNNLITNAVKYHITNQKDPFIKISVNEIKDNLHIEVEDNGKGIKDEFIDKIFDMYFRASEDSTGSGLGLYIAKETVSKLGGRISVRSEYGNGSIFTIIFSSNT